MSHDADPQADALIRGLLRPQAYPHPVAKIELRETHISWVFLTGEFAYKLKKPVDFGFLDFSTLEKRRYFCEEELRLNGRYAPQLYLAVAPITGSMEEPRLEGEGEALEYAVKMRQFDEAGLFINLFKQGLLTPAIMDDTAQVIARFHQDIASAGADSPYGSAEAVHAPVGENFAQLATHATELLQQAQVKREFDTLQSWSEETHRALKPVFAQRKAEGFIRECHGDLHLGNITLIEDEVVPFDGIEFNPNLRWIDVMSELAFLLMDLEEHRARPLAYRLRNAYLQISGDYAGLAVLAYYQCYRAMVRAKVAALRLGQAGAAKTEAEQEVKDYLRAALGYTQKTTPSLMITHGLSGSGKTTLSQGLIEQEGYIRIRSDVERKRLFGFAASDKTRSQMGGGIYTASASEETYKQLEKLAHVILTAGYPVIVDATFLKQAQRTAFLQLARQHGVPFKILHCEAAEDELKARIRQRQAEDRDASEAGIAVLERQIQSQEPLCDAEQQYVMQIEL